MKQESCEVPMVKLKDLADFVSQKPHQLPWSSLSTLLLKKRKRRTEKVPELIYKRISSPFQLSISFSGDVTFPLQKCYGCNF